MRGYITYSLITLKLTLRDRMVLFFSYLFPLLFFVIFAQVFGSSAGGGITQVLTMVFILGVLGNGFFGGGMRAVMERDLNILRRFKVAPITPGPILAASIFTGWVTYLPSAIFFLLLAKFLYGMAMPSNLLSLVALLSLGAISFRAMGLIIASVVNSPQESQVVIQLLYLPMLFLSGATFPLTSLPQWLQVVAHYMPATYLYTSLQGTLLRGETLFTNWLAVVALCVTTAVSLLLSMKLFRWEKEEKVKTSAKMWILAAMAPFVLMGVWETHSREDLLKVQILNRQAMRNARYLITNARIFTGDGSVIEDGSVFVREGKIVQVYRGEAPDAGRLKAQLIDAVGKTLLPGFIDTRVHLSAPGGIPDTAGGFDLRTQYERELAAYLFCGVTTVMSVGDPLDTASAEKRRLDSGEILGSELALSGPVFTAPGGLALQFLRRVPERLRNMVATQFVRTPATPGEARQMVRELKIGGAAAISAVLDAGTGGAEFPRPAPDIFRAIAEEAARLKLPLVVKTGDAGDVQEALDAGAAVIAHGSAREALPDEVWQRMAKTGVFYSPDLAAVESLMIAAAGRLSLADHSLAQQVTPRDMLERTRQVLQPKNSAPKPVPSVLSAQFDIAKENLKRAAHAGVPLLVGTGSGDSLLLHGPALHRELQLWVEAGVSPAAALQAATREAARLLGHENRLGLIKPGFEATLVVVEGNPLEEISSTERVSTVLFKGERIVRSDLLKDWKE